jgi:four helix bundle protein
MKQNHIQERTFGFALMIIKHYKVLIENKEYVISKQLLKSGTSIAANQEEADCPDL